MPFLGAGPGESENPYTQAIRRATQQSMDVISEVMGADSEVDPLFIQDFINALLAGGIHVTPGLLAPDDLNKLVETAWNDPTIQSDFSSGLYDELGAPSFKSYLQKALFSDANSPLIEMGLGLKQQQGQTLTSSEVKALGFTAEQVPMPFDPQYMTVSGYGFDAPDSDFASGVHEGVDYGLPEGTPLYSIAAGTVITAGWSGGYGNLVTVKLANGMTVRYGHLSNLGVTVGEQVNPGELLGESGTTGNSSGPHLHFEIRDANGTPIDPGPILQQINGGVTFSSLGWSGAAGSGVSKTDAKNRLLGIDPILNAKYAPMVALWKKYFGVEPTVQQTLSMAARGPDVIAVEDFIRGMPSPIQGMNTGQRFDLRSLVDTTMQKALGHQGTDGIVKELFDRGDTAPGEVQHFINLLSENALKQMGGATYNAYYAANQRAMQGIYNATGFDPRIAQAQHAAAGGVAATNTQVAAAVSRSGGALTEFNLPTEREPFPGAALTPAPQDDSSGGSGEFAA